VGDVIATGLAWASVATLFWAGLTHLSHSRQFVSVLVRQKVWPKDIARVIAALIIAAELTIGGLGIVSLVPAFELVPIQTVALSATGSLYGAYACYSLFLWRRRPEAPCGCSPRDYATNGWVVSRAGLLCVAAFVGVASSDSLGEIASFSPDAFVSLAFGLSLATVWWLMPELMVATNRLGIREQEVQGT
jgi:hypothetical protein